jgi:D-glycero-D-manno-heptose 1,7-bisphosphate phosphatase
MAQVPSERRPLALDPPQTARASARARARAPAAVFLDRDGVLDAAVPDPLSGQPESPLQVADARLLPGAAEAVCKLAQAGFALVCVSNQPAAAKGRATVAQLLAVHERVLELLAMEGTRLQASRLCPHHPDGVVAELSGPCPCRKPAPGMLLDAAETLGLDLRRSWMIGDTDADVAAGRAAGCRTVLIEYPGSAHKRSGGAGEDLLASDLADAAARVLARGAR